MNLVSAALIALPFLFPFVAGPSANVWQLLTSWLCIALLFLAGPRARPSGWPLTALALLAAAIAWRGAGGDASMVSGALVAVGATALAAFVGAGLSRAGTSDQSALAWGLLLAGVLSAVLGLLQYYGAAASLKPFTTTPELGQAYGNLRQRNQFATLISMALVAALWLHASVMSRRGRNWRVWRIWLMPAVGLLLVLAAAASTSRTGLLQWLSICGVAAALAWGERRSGLEKDLRLPHPLLLLGLVPAYFAAAWVLPMLAGPDVEDMLRRLRVGAPEGNSRMLLWRNVIDLIAMRPWVGWGWGELSYAHFSTLYGGPRFVEILDNAHNLPLQLAVEAGIPASLAICGVFGVMALAARPWREREPTRLMAWGVLGAIVLHSLLEYPLWYGPFQLVFGVCIGLLWPASRAATEPTTSPLRAPAIAAVALLSSAIGYAAWDYTRISQIYVARADRLAPWRDDTLNRLEASWLYAGQVRFAALTLMPVTAANAAEVHALALRVVHFSPEPKVIAKLVESAMLIGREDEAAGWAARFKIAFPVEYAQWLAGKPMEEPKP
ncbi:PglL family O-oligosaccharyltransferase [Variovorax sp. RHLX14]|uniref:PglL family O-oligosaccharyltransferase n=1 Tax=Variovorax sp. RHLX14 TaxID=1259731 RepID=UPI003F447C6F